MQQGDVGSVPVASAGLDAPPAEEDRILGAAARRRGLWAGLRRQRVAMGCLGIILVFGLAALLAPILAPHDPNFGYDDGLTQRVAPLSSSAKFLLGTDPKIGRASCRE